MPGLTLMDVSSMEEVVKHMTLGKQNRCVRPVLCPRRCPRQQSLCVLCFSTLSDHRLGSSIPTAPSGRTT